MSLDMIIAEDKNIGEELLQGLIDRGIDVASIQYSDGETLLHLAARAGQIGVVQKLIDIAEIDVNAQDKSGITALHWAVYNGDIEIVKKLLAVRARIDIEANDLYLMIEAAQRLDDDVNAQDRNDIYRLVHRGYTELLRGLLAARARVNIEPLHDDEEEETPLALAARLVNESADRRILFKSFLKILINTVKHRDEFYLDFKECFPDFKERFSDVTFTECFPDVNFNEDFSDVKFNECYGIEHQISEWAVGKGEIKKERYEWIEAWYSNYQKVYGEIPCHRQFTGSMLLNCLLGHIDSDKAIHTNKRILTDDNSLPVVNSPSSSSSSSSSSSVVELDDLAAIDDATDIAELSRSSFKPGR